MSRCDLPGAPAPGTEICGSDIEGIHAFGIAGFPLLVIRDTSGLRGFVNLCPHQYLPLDHRSGGLLLADGRRLICSSHQAQFDSTTGEVCVGPASCGLDPVALSEKGGKIVIPEQVIPKVVCSRFRPTIYC
ncbi:MAG: Rieske (2Fe-2S) protein [Paracoccus sp. (in: a-proteobacteria)]